MRASIAVALLAGGCWYNPPDLPLIDDVPIVPKGSCANERTAHVACVLDGDTFDVGGCGGDNERIRMLGIDAPEIAHEDSPADCYGPEAEVELRRLLAGAEVLLSFDQECVGFYGRTLAYVWLDVGEEELLNVNEYMLLEGYARVYDEDFGNPIALKDEFLVAQSVAQARGLGLWSACE